jgi:hypothetical protein
MILNNFIKFQEISMHSRLWLATLCTVLLQLGGHAAAQSSKICTCGGQTYRGTCPVGQIAVSCDCKSITLICEYKPEDKPAAAAKDAPAKAAAGAKAANGAKAAKAAKGVKGTKGAQANAHAKKGAHKPAAAKTNKPAAKAAQKPAQALAKALPGKKPPPQ